MEKINDEKSVPFYILNHIKLILGTPAQSTEAAKFLSPLTLHNTSFILSGTTIGLVTGAYLASRDRSTQFMAENMHRLPTTKSGWHSYHTAKNRSLIEHGISGGLRYASRFALLFSGFAFVESLVESRLGIDSVMSSIAAGGISGVGLGSAYKMNSRNTMLVSLMGLSAGLVYALANEGCVLINGASFKYPNKKRAFRLNI